MTKFRNPRRVFWLGGLLLAILTSAFLAFKGLAQNQNTGDLLTRLQQRNLPVVSVTTISRIPYRVKIVLKSDSDTNHLTVEDNWSMLLAERETGFAYRIGSKLASYQLVVVNQHEEVLSSSESFLYPTDKNQQLPPGQPTLSNAEIRDHVQKTLNFNGLTVRVLDVLDENAAGSTGKVLMIEATSLDIMSANQALPGFLKDYFRLLESINPEDGSNLVLTHLRVEDKSGKVLLDYVKDLEAGTSQWTLAEGVYNDWFPQTRLSIYATQGSPETDTTPALPSVYPPPATVTPVGYP